MIARIFYIIILLTLLPDIYIYRSYLRHRFDFKPWQHFVWWQPGAAMMACTIMYAMISNFAPDNLTWFNIYLFLIGLLVLPKAIFAISSIAGKAARRALRLKRNWGNYIGLVLVLGELYVLFNGSMWGVSNLTVRHITLQFDNLPKAFNGYRIAHFTDAHVGTIRNDVLQKAVSEMNDAHADAIVFTGDLQNMQPKEIVPHMPTLSALKAKDGVFAVLGNHDYAKYMKLTPKQQRSNEQLTCSLEQAMGWQLLLNSHHIVRRGNDSIVIAGTENDGLPPFPCKADIARALNHIGKAAFVVMLQHDPSAWQRTILPQSHAQLTLSGHTHGGQMSLFGLRPTQLVGKNDAGLYTQGDRMLYVSTGIGGFLPFRFHMNPEIVIITLKTKDKK